MSFLPSFEVELIILLICCPFLSLLIDYSSFSRIPVNSVPNSSPHSLRRAVAFFPELLAPLLRSLPHIFPSFSSFVLDFCIGNLHSLLHHSAHAFWPPPQRGSHDDANDAADDTALRSVCRHTEWLQSLPHYRSNSESSEVGTTSVAHASFGTGAGSKAHILSDTRSLGSKCYFT